MVGEDFSYYLLHKTGAHFFLGVGGDCSGTYYPLHSAFMCPDEKALAVGCEMLLGIYMDYSIRERHRSRSRTYVTLCLFSPIPGSRPPPPLHTLKDNSFPFLLPGAEVPSVPTQSPDWHTESLLSDPEPTEGGSLLPG